MLEAYIDDSASDSGDGKRLFLAGYIQSSEAWSRLTEDWKVELAKPPALMSLHMTKCFEGWSADAREAKIDALVSVLKKYKPLSIECSISRAAYVNAISPKAPFDLRHPYFPCFVGILHGVARAVIEEGLSGPVKLTFDEQGKVGSETALWYAPLKHSDPTLRSVLGESPSFGSDDDVVPIQTADMLAWYVRRSTEARCSARQHEVVNEIRFRHRCVDITDRVLTTWSDAFERVPGVSDTIGKRGSVSTFMRKLVTDLPTDRVAPVLNTLHKRAIWLRRMKAVLTTLGLERVWKRIARRILAIR